MNAAMWAPKELTRAEAAFRASLRRHPNPDVEARIQEQAMRDGLALIERVNTIGGGKG